MKIGEFAVLCGTEISVLRHYAKEGLLIPSYTDLFTGYRHYDAKQRDLFLRITSLKKAGFSLKEIRNLLYQKMSDEEILALIRAKTAYFTDILRNLKEAEQTLVTKGDPSMKQINYQVTIHTLNEEKRLYELKTAPLDPAAIPSAFGFLSAWAQREGYQRISGFKTYGTPDSPTVQVAIEAIRLLDSAHHIRDNTNIPFENDESIVGKWEILGEYAIKEDFFAEREPVPSALGDWNRVLYFLPNGEKYWVYRWTKGRLIIENKRSASVNPYVLEEWQGERLMFVEYKSYAYAKGGATTVLVLRQLDNNAYTKEEIAHRDNIDLPFRPDPDVLGEWNITALCRTKEEFDETAPAIDPKPYLHSITFSEDGTCTSRYGDGNERVRTWTAGFVLDTTERLACAYEIRELGGRDYLFLEFKNGDVIFGGFNPFYFILSRNI